uniref:Uncharacterized protein n=1 Tax=Amphimedon queenslandica TaxID=400682 RepID=A0A1X7SDV6_AMPQE
MYKVLVTVLLVALNVKVLIYKSLIAPIRIISDDNALKPCPQKRKVAVDSNTDNTALVVPRSKKDDKLIVSINLKDLKTKFNVKDDDSCSSLIVSIKLSNIKCKPKDDNTKCVVKNDHCSSSLIVSIKLSSIKLKISNPKK